MLDFLVYLRNRLWFLLYRFIVRPILFAFDPELVHDLFLLIGRFLGSNPLTRPLVRIGLSYQNGRLRQELLGIEFRNPIGLAAGFDKNAEMIRVMSVVGFGFQEVGSVTGDPCAGNPRPRLWRLTKSKSLLVYYGLKNRGSLAIKKHLEGFSPKIPLGINIAMTNRPGVCSVDESMADYAKSLGVLAELGNYFTVNISCPNTSCGQIFHDPQNLDRLLTELDRLPVRQPIFIKISLDLDLALVDQILDVAAKHRVKGFILGNLSKNYQAETVLDKEFPRLGGLSGQPLRELALTMIRHVYRRAAGRFIIIGCGGVFRAEDAYAQIRAGASLVQLVTGMIYRGPQAISDINLGLVRLLDRDGLANISQAVGLDSTV